MTRRLHGRGVEQLAAVVAAATERRRAEETYRAAILGAVETLRASGDRRAFARVASAAGVSRQAVRDLVTRAQA